MKGHDHLANSPPEVGLRSIEDEHVRLVILLKDMRDMCGYYFESNHQCQDCNRERQASCQGLFPSYALDFLELVIEHFENEDALIDEIREIPEFELELKSHKKAHLQILRELEGLLQDMKTLNSQGQTVMALRVFHERADSLLNEHTQLFDAPLVRKLHEEHQRFDTPKGGSDA